LLADALGEIQSPRRPGRRARSRRLLALAIEHATLALHLAGDDQQVLSRARSTLLGAHAERAEDALRGAGQLSLSAQRAPTVEACGEGWRNVEVIVAGAEASARAAATIALELEVGPTSAPLVRAAHRFAHRAEAAARAARQIVENRNHAYTFHTDGGFSFGEGWYLAAAAVLEGVAIQIEPNREGALQAETFLHAAGLAARLQPYRSRPRAMKHTTAIVAREFRADPISAQRRLRRAFLGEAPVEPRVIDWIERRLARAPRERKVLLWIRDGAHHAGRNTRVDELLELVRLVERARLVPILIGDALGAGKLPEGAIDMILFWKAPVFRGAEMRRAQLQFFEHLQEKHGLIGQLGVTTAGMDGPALMGLPTLYLTDEPNVRMGQWVGAVPGYREVVREGEYLEHIAEVLSEWATGPRAPDQVL